MASNFSFPDFFVLFVSFVVRLMARTSLSIVQMENGRGEQSVAHGAAEPSVMAIDNLSSRPVIANVELNRFARCESLLETVAA